MNVAFNGLLQDGKVEPSKAPMFWDLRAESLEKQALEPIKAMEEMRELSGQTKAPTMDWNGDVLADFGVDELIPFLKKHGVE